jgi:hypothetical protein
MRRSSARQSITDKDDWLVKSFKSDIYRFQLAIVLKAWAVAILADDAGAGRSNTDLE